jgi:hypothetical protein
MPCQDISYGLRRWNRIVLVFWSFDRGYEPRGYNPLWHLLFLSRAGMHPLHGTVYTNSSQGAASGKDKVAIVVRACVWRNSGG